MKAIALESFGGPEIMTYTNVEKPSVSDDQVLIKVHATSVNRPDIVQRQGNYHPPKGDSEILGLEVAGVIDQVGSNVTEWKRGDRVFALVGGGGYGEYAVAHPDHVMATPDSLTDEQAACICETYITAYLNIFLLGKLVNGESILLHGGGGGVNTAAIQLCQQLVADTKMFVTASPSKVVRVKELGVHHVIDYQSQSFAAEIKEITQGKGVNVILDHIGAHYLQDNMKSLSVSGRMVLIGVTSGIKAELNLALMMVKRQQIIGSVLRSRSVEEKAEIIKAFTAQVLPLFANKTIVPLVSKVFPLEHAADAHRMMESSEHFGKIALSVSSNKQ